mmetsp:Transcript_24294/g.54045  ORF Transcript_24294/g.54045 Transcript_24294/m.54045 type:complete len:278 (-) Transcript_24294:451-1284(-)
MEGPRIDACEANAIPKIFRHLLRGFDVLGFQASAEGALVAVILDDPHPVVVSIFREDSVIKGLRLEIEHAFRTRVVTVQHGPCLEEGPPDCFVWVGARNLGLDVRFDGVYLVSAIERLVPAIAEPEEAWVACEVELVWGAGPVDLVCLVAIVELRQAHGQSRFGQSGSDFGVLRCDFLAMPTPVCIDHQENMLLRCNEPVEVVCVHHSHLGALWFRYAHAEAWRAGLSEDLPRLPVLLLGLDSLQILFVRAYNAELHARRRPQFSRQQGAVSLNAVR